MFSTFFDAVHSVGYTAQSVHAIVACSVRSEYGRRIMKEEKEKKRKKSNTPVVVILSATILSPTAWSLYTQFPVHCPAKTEPDQARTGRVDFGNSTPVEVHSDASLCRHIICSTPTTVTDR